MTKESVKLIVVKKGKKYINTITGKSVSASTAKRLNSYFERNPEATLYEAYGKSRYKPGEKYQSKSIRKILSLKLFSNKRKTQIVQTRGKKGKIKYYSPITKKEISIKEYKKLTRLIVIKKGKKYINTITGKSVSASTAKRLNSYFERNPEATLYEAYGKSRYKPGEKYQSKSIRKILSLKLFSNKRKTQIVQTRGKKGKIKYYSPITKKEISIKEYKKLTRFDFKRGQFKVQLYRLTVDKGRVYHIISTNLKWQFENHDDIDTRFYFLKYNWMPEAKKIIREIEKKYPLSRTDVMHVTFTHDIYSNIDSYPGGVTVMEQMSPKSGLRFFPIEIEKGRKVYHALLQNYKIIIVYNVKIFIYSFSTYETRAIAESRLGILKKK